MAKDFCRKHCIEHKKDYWVYPKTAAGKITKYLRVACSATADDSTCSSGATRKSLHPTVCLFEGKPMQDPACTICHTQLPDDPVTLCSHAKSHQCSAYVNSARPKSFQLLDEEVEVTAELLRDC